MYSSSPRGLSADGSWHPTAIRTALTLASESVGVSSLQPEATARLHDIAVALGLDTTNDKEWRVAAIQAALALATEEIQDPNWKATRTDEPSIE